MRYVAIIAMAITLNGCAPWIIAIGTTLSGANAVYQNIGLITGELDKAIVTACAGWEVKKALAQGRIQAGTVQAAKQQKFNIIAEYADAACNPANPPPDGDPLQTVIWLAELGGQVDALTAFQPQP